MNEPRRWTAVATGVVALLAVGCSSGGSSPAPAPTTLSPTSRSPTSSSASLGLTNGDAGTLNCPDFIGSDAPPPDYVIVDDAVALPGRTRSALQTSENTDADGTRLFAKAGLLIKAGQTSELSVTVPARIGWGKPGTPVQRLSIPACPAASSGSGWLAYAGGYYVEATKCLPVTVRHAGLSEIVLIGVGTPCPGQQPPPMPTES